MPASEEGLINLIKLINNTKLNNYIDNLEKLTKSSAERCNDTLNIGEISTELLETTIFINSNLKNIMRKILKIKFYYN